MFPHLSPTVPPPATPTPAAVNVATLMDVGERTQMVLDRIAYEGNAEKFAEQGEGRGAGQGWLLFSLAVYENEQPP